MVSFLNKKTKYKTILVVTCVIKGASIEQKGVKIQGNFSKQKIDYSKLFL